MEAVGGVQKWERRRSEPALRGIKGGVLGSHSFHIEEAICLEAPFRLCFRHDLVVELVFLVGAGSKVSLLLEDANQILIDL